MSEFSGLSSNDLEESQDRLGGFTVYDTDAYDAKVKVAYASKAASGARALNVIFDLKGNEYRETLWVTNKKGENWYPNPNDKTKKLPLPGFTIAEDLCLVTCEKTLEQMATEEKVVNVYDPEQKKELPKSVPVLVELLGKDVSLGIIKQIVNKQKKNDNNEYVDTDEVREENVIDKIFHYPSGTTVPEARAKVSPPTFKDAWVKRNQGVARDRTKKDGNAPQSGKPAPTGGQGKTTSLFGS